MPRSRRIFVGWFAALLAWFLLANLAGLVRPRGLKPFRSAGFPLTVAAWGFGFKGGFDWSALALDAAFAIATSAVVASVLARAAVVRARSVGEAARPV
jgi:hypothetical protein